MKTTAGKIRDSTLWGDTVSTGDRNEWPLREKGPWKFSLRRHGIIPSGMKMKDHWGKNPWKFSRRRHDENPLGKRKEKKRSHWGQNPWKFSTRRHGVGMLRMRYIPLY
jgi:hypothetical protein